MSLKITIGAGAIFLSGLVIADSLFADEAADRVAHLRHNAELGVATFEQQMAAPGFDPEIRQLTAAAFTMFTLDKDIDKAEAYLKLALSTQNMDPQSPSYGDIPWTVQNKTIHDRNGIEFAMSNIGPLALRYCYKLTPDLLREVTSHAQAALAAVRRHEVPVAYTNIYLMKIENLLLLGQIANDPPAVAEARANLDTWLAFTKQNGVSEYDSPTYSFTQLEAVRDAYISAPDAETKAKLRLAMDYIWADLCANYFPAQQFLSGARSRSYDFIWQRGTLLHEYYAEGLRDDLDGHGYLGGVWLTSSAADNYHPPGSVLALAAVPEKVVEQTFGPEQDRVRYNYITPDFAIGSSSAYYGPQDMEIGVDLASKKNLPVISVVSDTSDSPFGIKRTADRSGHMKPKHIRTAIATVQNKGTVLALLDLSPDLAKGSAASVATDVIIPMDADAVYVNGNKVNGTEKAFSIPLAAGSAVFVREGNAAVGVKIFAADGCMGQTPQFYFTYDGPQTAADGKRANVARLVAYHFKSKDGSEERITDKTVRSGVLVKAGHCGDDKNFDAFSKAFDSLAVTQSSQGDLWSATVQSEADNLGATLDLASRRMAARTIDGVPVPRRTLVMNNRDLNAEIFGPSAAPTRSASPAAQ